MVGPSYVCWAMIHPGIWNCTDGVVSGQIYVTENGTSVKGENDLPKDQILQDSFRAQYFRDYVNALAEAYTLDNVDVRGYMAWSLMEYVLVEPEQG